MSNLLDQWNEHIIKGNQLSRELEDFEGIMHVAGNTDSKVAISDGAGTTYIDRVLSPEKMTEIKRIVVAALTEAKLTKEVELEKLMGRKPAYVNPKFEAAVQDMIQSVKTTKATADPVPDKPDLNDNEVENVRRMYHDECKTMKEIAEHYGVNKTRMNAFISKHNLRRTSYSKDFRDPVVEKQRKEKKPDEKERP